MSGIVISLFVISLLFFIGSLHKFFLLKKTASYPPKHVLKKKAATLGAGGFLFLFIFIMVYYLH
jgi:hypothetical protein